MANKNYYKLTVSRIVVTNICYYKHLVYFLPLLEFSRKSQLYNVFLESKIIPITDYRLVLLIDILVCI